MLLGMVAAYYGAPSTRPRCVSLTSGWPSYNFLLALVISVILFGPSVTNVVIAGHRARADQARVVRARRPGQRK